MRNELEIHKQFMLGESNNQEPEILIQSVVDAIEALSPSSNRDRARKNYSLTQLRKLKFAIKRMQSKIDEANEL